MGQQEQQSEKQPETVEKKEADKKKAMNVSKWYIERGVKERKRNERDHDDFNFVYLKVAKRTCKETISRA